MYFCFAVWCIIEFTGCTFVLLFGVLWSSQYVLLCGSLSSVLQNSQGVLFYCCFTSVPFNDAVSH
jgi:hypothetical protein